MSNGDSYSGPERRVKLENRLTKIEMRQDTMGEDIRGLCSEFKDMRGDLQGWQESTGRKVAVNETNIRWLNWKLAGEGVSLMLTILGLIYAIMRLQ